MLLILLFKIGFTRRLWPNRFFPRLQVAFTKRCTTSVLVEFFLAVSATFSIVTESFPPPTVFTRVCFFFTSFLMKWCDFKNANSLTFPLCLLPFLFLTLSPRFIYFLILLLYVFDVSFSLCLSSILLSSFPIFLPLSLYVFFLFFLLGLLYFFSNCASFLLSIFSLFFSFTYLALSFHVCFSFSLFPLCLRVLILFRFPSLRFYSSLSFSFFFHLFIFFLFSSNLLLLPLCIFALSLFSVFPFLFFVFHHSLFLPSPMLLATLFSLSILVFPYSSHCFMSCSLSLSLFHCSLAQLFFINSHTYFIRCACSITVISAKCKISKSSSNFDLICFVHFVLMLLEKA